MKSVTVAGVRLMEDLYDANSLTSKKAREAIYLKKTILALLEKTGRIFYLLDMKKVKYIEFS